MMMVIMVMVVAVMAAVVMVMVVVVLLVVVVCTLVTFGNSNRQRTVVTGDIPLNYSEWFKKNSTSDKNKDKLRMDINKRQKYNVLKKIILNFCSLAT
jgi:maltose-binding protein MalE